MLAAIWRHAGTHPIRTKPLFPKVMPPSEALKSLTQAKLLKLYAFLPPISSYL